MGSVEQKLNEKAARVIRLAQIELGATRTRYRVRAKWKKLGPKAWQPYAVQRTPYKGRLSNTGKAANSLGYELVKTPGEYALKFYSTEDYVVNLEEGRLPGKYAPVREIQDWIKSKPIRPRNAQGGFIKNTPKARQAIGFMINRKIKYFGIAPTRFFSDPFFKVVNEDEEGLLDAVALDLENLIR